MRNTKEHVALKLALVALAMAVGVVALPRNAIAWGTKQIAQAQWQQARVDQSRHDQERIAWARWQSGQVKQARLYQEKLSRANVYRARVLGLQRKARVQLAKIESWHKRAARLARQKAAREKQRQTSRQATAKNKQFVQVVVRAH